MRQRLSPRLVTSARTCSARSMSSYPMAHKCPPLIIGRSSGSTAAAARSSLFRFLEQVHPLPVRRGDLCNRIPAGDFLGAVVHQRVPEGSPADRKADEPGHGSSGRNPLENFLLVLAAAQD